jgi:1,2-dihydroxy-3-keto-5-methylthiopentene dioxygenase
MALVQVRGVGHLLEDQEEVAAFLERHGVRHRRWRALPASARPLDDAGKQAILEHYARELGAEKEERGYVAADVVALAPTTPGLDEICAKFDREHTHDDDEVRLVVSGHGTFTVRGSADEAIDITMGPGDYIVVPRDRRHWFTLLADRSIVAVRLFKDHSGWTPRYAGAGTGETGIAPAALARVFGVGS